MKTSPLYVAFFYYIVVNLLQEALQILAKLLEPWTDSGDHRAEKMPSTLIGADLDKNENEVEKPEVRNVKEKQSSILEEPKFDEL